MKVGAYKLAVSIIMREIVVGLYRGLGVVLRGIIPKTAIRFYSFNINKGLLADKHTGLVSGPNTFAGMSFSRDPSRAADVSFAQKMGLVVSVVRPNTAGGWLGGWPCSGFE